MKKVKTKNAIFSICRDEILQQMLKGGAISKLDLEYNERPNEAPALTLGPECLGRHGRWTVRGEVHEDYSSWINEFHAVRNDGEWVAGDCERVVYASSKEAYYDFVRHFPATYWNYWDI